MIRVLILWGVLVWYSGPYVGGPLRCGSMAGASPLYDESHEWIAVDIDALGWHCGDLIGVRVGDETYHWRIQDSGPLSRYGVMVDGEYVPIVGDLPEHAFTWPGLNVRAVVWNETVVRERLWLER